MDGRQRGAEVIVVGAGIVGAACASALAEEGFGVTVLEGALPGGGATAACMGHVVVMDDSPAQLALGHLSQRAWDALAEPLCQDVDGRAVERDPCGTLWLAEDEEEMAAVRAKHANYTENGIEAQILDARALAEAEPGLRSGLAGALRVPGDSVVYPPAAVHWLLEQARRACRRRGRRFVLRAPLAVDSVRVGSVRVGSGEIGSGGSMARVRLRDGGELRADRVVLAAGQRSLDLLPPGATAHVIRPRKGHLVITDRRPGFCRHQLVELGYLKSAHGAGHTSVAFNLQPRATGQMLLGSSRQFGRFTAEVEPAIVARMVARGQHFLPRLGELKAIRVWAGFRPATDDHLPLVGPVPGMPSVLLAAGHEGLGITTSLGTARLVVDHLLDRPSPIDPTPYLPSRPAPPASEGEDRA